MPDISFKAGRRAEEREAEAVNGSRRLALVAVVVGISLACRPATWQSTTRTNDMGHEELTLSKRSRSGTATLVLFGDIKPDGKPMGIGARVVGIEATSIQWDSGPHEKTSGSDFFLVNLEPFSQSRTLPGIRFIVLLGSHERLTVQGKNPAGRKVKTTFDLKGFGLAAKPMLTRLEWVGVLP